MAIIPRMLHPGALQGRRQNLVNRLFAQYSGQRGQAGGGTPFAHSPGSPRTIATQFDNVNPNVSSMLGPGGSGRPLPFDRSGFPGQGLPFQHDPGGPPLPTAPPVPLPGPPTTNPGNGIPFPQPTQQQQPTGIPPSPPQPGFIPSTMQSPDGVPLPGVGLAPGAGTPLPGVGNPGGPGVPPDAIDLGGGVYWSPTLGIIDGSNPGNTLGGSSGSIGGGNRLGNTYQ